MAKTKRLKGGLPIKKPLKQMTLFGPPEKAEPRRKAKAAPPAGPADHDTTCKFMDQPVRVFLRGGKTWVVAKDVCDILGLGNVSKATIEVPEDEKGITKSKTLRGTQSLVCISVDAANFIAIRSNKPEGKKLAWWLVKEVLPSIQATGSYTAPVAEPVDNDFERRVRQVRKRLGCDEGTAKKRVMMTLENKKQDADLYKKGAKREDYRAVHNAGHRGLTGKDVAELRLILGLGADETPLDHYGEIPLMIMAIAKSVANRLVKDGGSVMAIEARIELLERIVGEHKQATIATMGRGYRVGLTDDLARGPIIDVIRQLTQASAN